MNRYFSTQPRYNAQFSDSVVPSLCASETMQSGRMHTHGFTGNDGFSGQDVLNTNNDSYAGVYRPHYVATPCGHIDKLVGPDAVVLDASGNLVVTGHGIYRRLPAQTSTTKICVP